MVPKERAFNKLGHALHVEDPTFRRCTFDSRIQAIAQSLGMKRPVVPQSMYIFKQPGIGGEVCCVLTRFAWGGRVRSAMNVMIAAHCNCALPPLQVVPHQDSTFLHTEPMTTTGFWIPLQVSRLMASLCNT